MKISTSTRSKLQQLEGFRDVVYIPVPGDRVTIGYGFTDGVKMGDTMTRDEAAQRLITELSHYEKAVESACTNPPNQNQFDSLVLLCYNIGIAGFCKSTVLRCHNAGDYQSAARAFGLWDKSSGKVYAGLTKRRAEESALYLTPVPDDVSDPVTPAMPQRIDSESSMTASPINRASVIAGGTATVAAVSEITKTISEIKVNTESLGNWILPILLLCVVGLCGFTIWQRIKQRRSGWA